MYILHTQVISSLRRPERAAQVGRWLGAKSENQLFLSVITLGEIERGIAQQAERNPAFASELRDWLDRTVSLFSDRIIPFDTDAARIFGRLSAKLGNSGADLLIAATAISRNAVVVTGDAAFAATGARVENPF